MLETITNFNWPYITTKQHLLLKQRIYLSTDSFFIKLTGLFTHQMCRNVKSRFLRALDLSRANLVAFHMKERTDAMTCTHVASRFLCVDVSRRLSSGSSWRCAARRVFCCGRRWMRGWSITRGVFGAAVRSVGGYLCKCAVNEFNNQQSGCCVSASVSAGLNDLYIYIWHLYIFICTWNWFYLLSTYSVINR